VKHTFSNANLEPVPYDGSEVTWRVSAYALIIRDGKLLLAKSKHEKFYDVIGGGVDIGETIEEALHREAAEEAGAQIEIGKLLFTAMDWFYHRKGKFYQTLQLYYQAELVGELGKATDPDIEWTEFVPIADVGQTYTLAVSESAERSIRQFLASSVPT
jgi:8-oxo-dGTP pyrophosphatase MutT (NUDIX family)